LKGEARHNTEKTSYLSGKEGKEPHPSQPRECTFRPPQFRGHDLCKHPH